MRRLRLKFLSPGVAFIQPASVNKHLQTQECTHELIFISRTLAERQSVTQGEAMPASLIVMRLV